MNDTDRGMLTALIGVVVFAGGLFSWLPWFVSLMIVGIIMVIIGLIVATQ